MEAPHPLQLGAWITAIVGGLVAAGLGIWQAVLNRRQRAKELRWRQAEAGKKLIDEMLDDKLADAALTMLDSDERTFRHDDQTYEVTSADVVAALTLSEKGPHDNGPKAKFIRDCFDSLFFFFAIFEHYIQTELTTFEDVREPAEYYVRELADDKELHIAYIKEVLFRNLPAFMNRFDSWRSKKPYP